MIAKKCVVSSFARGLFFFGAMLIALPAIQPVKTFAGSAAPCSTCGCSFCNHGTWSNSPTPDSRPEKDSPEYLELIEGKSSQSGSGANGFVPSPGGTQVVFLEFDSATDPGEFVYSPAQRAAVRDGMAARYADFDFSFTLTPPTSGAFSRITFNAGSPGGLASALDFRNVNQSDTAIVNINGLPVPGGVAGFITASINIGAHELGHLVGLRHADSFDPVLSGVTSGRSANFNPNFPGPEDADETTRNLMGSPGSVGSSISDVDDVQTFSLRAATKLTFNEYGVIIDEIAGAHGTLGSAQPLTLSSLPVPNTALPTDDAFGMTIRADAIAVEGSISAGGQLDVYSFTAKEGDIFNFEVISQILGSRFGNTIDPFLSIFDSTGSFIDYYGADSFNDDELENFDSRIIDLTIPADGTYYAQVRAFSAGDTGGYEFYATRFTVIPEPSSIALVILAVVPILRLGRKRSYRTSVH